MSLDAVRFGTSNAPNLTMPQVRLGVSQVKLGQDRPKSKFQLSIPNQTSDLGYPKCNLGHGNVWSTTEKFSLQLEIENEININLLEIVTRFPCSMIWMYGPPFCLRYTFNKTSCNTLVTPLH